MKKDMSSAGRFADANFQLSVICSIEIGDFSAVDVGAVLRLRPRLLRYVYTVGREPVSLMFADDTCLPFRLLSR